MKIVAILLLVFGLSGCAALTGPGDYSEYTKALMSHSDSETARITNQAGAIVSVAESAIRRAQTPTEAALQSAFAAMSIGQLRPFPLEIKKPVTGMDVANSVAGGIPFMVMGWSNVAIAKAGIQSAGTTSFGDNAQVSDSFNPIENHATGSGTTATTTGTSTPTVVEQPAPVIVQ